MPSECAPPALSSRASWLGAAVLLFLLLHGGLADTSGRASMLLNKLDEVPDSAEGPRLVLDPSSYRGGGSRVEDEWSTKFRRLGWSSYTPVLVEVWRQLRPLAVAFSRRF